MRRHKPILFDQLREERRPARRSLALAAYNAGMQVLSGLLRLLAVLLATIIASVFLTILMTAVTQGVSLPDAAIQLWQEIQQI